MKKQEAQPETPLDEQIAKRAYALWEADGCPEGADVQHWLRAEAEMLDKLGSEAALSDESPEQL